MDQGRNQKYHLIINAEAANFAQNENKRSIIKVYQIENTTQK
jgi:hypothetical protein